MKRILMTGALGQIGTELALYLGDIYGRENILATDCSDANKAAVEDIRFEMLDVTDPKRMFELAKEFKADTIVNLAAILSARGESMPQLTWKVNVDGVVNTLEVARELNAKVFVPSSIAAFGAGTPLDNTPQVTIQRPNTMYGVTKVATELLSDYYFKKYGVDTRSVRFPGLISHVTLPGGGTTDYAVEIFYAAVKGEEFVCPIKPDTFMDMMYMPDALKAAVDIMNADASKLIHRNAFNIASMSFSPEIIYEKIKERIPGFKMRYEIDPVRQGIADSWPDSMDDSCARNEWGWKPSFTLEEMTDDMIKELKKKLL